jgi:hypothetical protein
MGLRCGLAATVRPSEARPGVSRVPMNTPSRTASNRRANASARGPVRAAAWI